MSKEHTTTPEPWWKSRLGEYKLFGGINVGQYTDNGVLEVARCHDEDTARRVKALLETAAAFSTEALEQGVVMSDGTTALLWHLNRENNRLRARVAELEAVPYCDEHRGQWIDNEHAPDCPVCYLLMLMRIHEDLLKAHGVESIGDLERKLAELETEQGWVSVKERLPDDATPQKVLVLSLSGSVSVVYDSRLVKDMLPGKTHFKYEVTHWMPLPKPPKETT